jgi:tRNA (guanine-N7-)-methyltransferase
MDPFSDQAALASSESHRPVRSFVRREGRLTPAQNRALSELLPRYRIDEHTKPLDLAVLFGNTHPVVMEIGFGNGSLLAEQSANYPQFNFVGIEVHRPGIGRLLQRLEEHDTSNVRIWEQDAITLLEHMLPAHSLSAIWLYFPDPWPKKRHHKRRIVNAHFLDLAARALKLHGVLHMATDWEDYAEHMRSEIENHQHFNEIARPESDVYPFNRPATHFEQRGIRKGHQVSDLYAVSSLI